MKKKGSIGRIIVITIIIGFVIAMLIQRTAVGETVQSILGLETKQTGTMGGFSANRAKTANAVNVEVKEIKPEDFIQTTNIHGELTASAKTTNIVSDTAGKVVSVLVEKGQEVKKGTPVAVIDPSTPGNKYKERTITSSFEGTLSSVEIYEGQSLSNNAVIAQVVKPGELVLTLNVPEQYLSSVAVGTKASFSVAAYPDEVYNAEVTWMRTSVDTSTRTVKTELKITNADSKLLAGMFVKTKVITKLIKNCHTVPTKSLSSYLGDSTVYIVQNGKACRVVVKTGWSNDTLTVITDGLSDGDPVIIGGSVTDGASVNVIN